MAHEKRAKYIPYLKEKLGDVPVFMDVDGPDNLGVWPNAKRCWLSFDPEATYHVVIQDDSIIGEDFYKRLDEVLDKGTLYAYSLFYRHKRRRTHDKMNKAAYAGYEKGHFTYPRLQWANAVVLPTFIIEKCIAFADTQNQYENIDDLRISAYLQKIGMQTFYPLPSLVNHRQEEDSLIGHINNQGRTATWFK
jgi:hypothetical protein